MALLLVRAGSPVSVDILIDALWNGAPPPSARRTLSVYISRLRAFLGADDRVEATSGFYALCPRLGELDSWTFRQLVMESRVARESGDRPTAMNRMRDGLALWRSPAYEGLHDLALVAAEAGVLERLRLSAFEEWMDLELDAGHHEGVLDQLEPMIAEHPYRERLRAQQMLALYRSGRQADALEAYRKTHQLLVTDLGVHPSATLTELHQRILAGDPMSSTIKPAQLPLAVRGFSGRSVELDRLDDMLAGSGDPSNAVTIIVISGMGGVGKTALALHWARRIAAAYPDGQLYLDLRGQSEHDQLTPVAALAKLLQAFGLKPEQVPADPVAAAGLFRSRVAGRRLLIMLDNARSTDQIRPLLPGGDCAVVVTSRHRLSDLRVHDGALSMDLDGLRPAEAEHLLAELLGDAHRSEPSVVAEIARLCGCLPLALRIAAARLAEQPERGSGWLRDELAGDDRLGALQMDGDEGVAVRAAFDLSYRSVPPGIQRLFTLLGLFPGTDFGVDAVAALAGLPRSAARRALGHLATVHMVRARPDGRYDFHDLIREYAQNLAADCEERQAARDRLYAWYARGAEKAGRILYPQFLMLSQGSAPETADPDLPDGTAAMTWLDSEFVALAAAIRHGIRDGQAEGTIRLADALRGYLMHRATLSDWLVITEAAMAAAGTVGDPRAEVAAHMHAATAYGLRDDYQRSIQHLLLAFELAQRIGWTISATMAQANLAGMYLLTGEIALAHRAVLHAKDTFLELGNDEQVTNAMLNLGVVLVEMGRPAEAVETIAEVFAKAGKLAMPSKWTAALVTYGLALHQSGQHQLARQYLTQALEHSRRLGNHALETLALAHLAAVASDEGHHDQAWDLANQATISAQVCGQARIEAVTLNLTAFLYIREGNGVGATAAAARAYDLARGVGARRTEIEALISLALGRHLVGEGRTGTESARHANEVAAKCGYEGLARQAAEILAQPQAALNRYRIS